jgi:hypothetical protein
MRVHTSGVDANPVFIFIGNMIHFGCGVDIVSGGFSSSGNNNKFVFFLDIFFNNFFKVFNKLPVDFLRHDERSSERYDDGFSVSHISNLK